MDTIEINGLAVSTRIGVHAWEQRILQPLLIDICMHTTLNNLGDDIARTVDYAAVAETVTETLAKGTYHLIETVAETVVECVRRVAGDIRVVVAVSKPTAIRNARDVRVCIDR
ncbi:dihydroneopterin aldolase FolB [Legionella geestiana]|uniref:dihydroneopterin aldolase n=1 Tax=Legionella geestiana TaxID=45065 RepID=A0A0W0U4P1_9GAMM|nr:dihydroneopterin aldolase [Legionella geestiana]KTD02668.1 dihydroneopterin aldolase FolB [Legionella geestiana]QBS12736.1 dihydroneopterin aldolase [Legionella geestiana]QDQ39549.1 dihydroneopterin aldolase [Legionella geestiana]STX54796.1 dihydroneopterin aldolase [Legionella geestiana]